VKTGTEILVSSTVGFDDVGSAGFDSRHRQWIFIFCTTIRPTVGPNHNSRVLYLHGLLLWTMNENFCLHAYVIYCKV
jgi:hypothetical protein